MYELNGLPEIIFPDYIPPPNVEPQRIEEEIQKKSRQLDIQTTREDTETQLQMETERVKRPRNREPSNETDPPKQKPKKEDNF